MATQLDLLRDQALGCVRCPLAAGRTQVVFGVGDPQADLMFVGEGPGRDEDLAGEPFVGRSGKLLDQLMAEELGLDRTACYIANVVKCRPPGNRDPRPEEIAACRPYLEEQLRLIRPRVVVTLGNFASRLLLDTTEGIRRLRGHSYPFDLADPAGAEPAGTDRTGAGPVHLVPTYHPAAALRSGGTVLPEMRADFVRAKRLLAGEPPMTHPVLQGRTDGADDTRALAGAVADLVRPGDLLSLVGGLGAGKTTFAQGFAARLGVQGPVTSPTFTLVRQYPCAAGRAGGVGQLLHADLYRLDRLAEVTDLALAELLDGSAEGADGAVALVEWGDGAAAVLGPDALTVTLGRPPADDEDQDDDVRTVVVAGGGAAWADRWERLATALSRWAVTGGDR